MGLCDFVELGLGAEGLDEGGILDPLPLPLGDDLRAPLPLLFPFPFDLPFPFPFPFDLGTKLAGTTTG